MHEMSRLQNYLRVLKSFMLTSICQNLSVSLFLSNSHTKMLHFVFICQGILTFVWHSVCELRAIVELGPSRRTKNGACITRNGNFCTVTFLVLSKLISSRVDI